MHFFHLKSISIAVLFLHSMEYGPWPQQSFTIYGTQGTHTQPYTLALRSLAQPSGSNSCYKGRGITVFSWAMRRKWLANLLPISLSLSLTFYLYVYRYVCGWFLYAVCFCMDVYLMFGCVRMYVYLDMHGLRLDWVCVVSVSVYIAKISLGNSHERHYFSCFFLRGRRARCLPFEFVRFLLSRSHSCFCSSVGAACCCSPHVLFHTTNAGYICF